jgi:outer membrane autotransporter protein
LLLRFWKDSICSPVRHHDRRHGDDRLSTYFFHPDLAAGNPTKSRLYAEAGNVATDGSWNTAPNAFSNGFFLTPYYADIDKDTSPAGYESDAIGFVTGYERRNDNHLYGFHLGIGHNELDFTGNGFSGNKEDQDVLTAGVHAMGSLYNWTWRGQVTGFYGWHDYEGLTGVGLQMHESADYESSGTSSNLMGGYLFKLGSHRLLPEAGLNHLWLRRDSLRPTPTTRTGTRIALHWMNISSPQWLRCAG